jgi:hypothetical protein
MHFTFQFGMTCVRSLHEVHKIYTQSRNQVFPHVSVRKLRNAFRLHLVFRLPPSVVE